MRIVLFLITNLAVLAIFSIILSIAGVDYANAMHLLIFAAVFGFGGSLISLMLSKTIALRSVGGQLINKPRNATEQWLVDTISHLAQQAGIGMPDVAIYYASDINAFATGARRDSSLVAVSSGLLENMNRDEAEAVLAHEISHISNGDMVTMTLLQGVVNTFVIFLSRIIARVISGALSNDRNINLSSTGYYFIAFILQMVFGVLASIITMWFSRYREFKADAGSANLVGSHKMIAALQKLKLSYEPQESSGIQAFCINGANSKFGELFLSHPHLDKRIEALRNLR